MKTSIFNAIEIAVVASAISSSAAASPSAVRVLTAMSTPLKSGHPILFLNGESTTSGVADDSLAARLQFPADQRYSKWSVLFEAPIRVEAVEVETCEGTKPFSDGVELFVDYNERRFFSDGGHRTVKFKVKALARALTLNFLESPGLCLENIRLKTGGDWLKPRMLAATGSSVLADGAFGVGPRTVVTGKKIKTIGSRKPGEWTLQWENPLIVESLRVWNGNQYPSDAFLENDRVRELEIRVDDGRATRVILEDRRFSQQVELKEPHAIRTLELRSLSTYPGAMPSEPILGEVQLSAGGENWIPIVPVTASSTSDTGESAQAIVVREKGYGDILDRELRADERGEVWKFRFRADGTFFARVFVDRARVAKAWSVTGVWRVHDKPFVNPDPKIETTLAMRSFFRALAKPGGVGNQAASTESPGLGLVLIGTKMATSEAFDSLPCANHCFSATAAKGEDRSPSKLRELPVLEQVELQRDRRAVFVLRNRTAQEKRTIEFSDLKVRIHSLYD